MSESRRPIFIACTPRSGSTLLRYILDAHPEIYCPPELHLLTLLKRCMQLGDDLGRAAGNGSTQSELVEALMRETRLSIDRIVGAVAAEYNKTIWCEKSTSTADDLALFNRVFPDARYICLYRHAADFVHSGMEITGHGFWPVAVHGAKNFVDTMARYWCQKTKAIHDFERENPGSCFRIRYESIVLQPDQTLPALFSFLGLRYSSDLVNVAFRSQHQLGEGDSKIQSTNRIETRRVGQGRGIPIHLIEPATLEQMNALLETLGYETVSPEWKKRSGRIYAHNDELTNRFARSKSRQIFREIIPTQLKRLLPWAVAGACVVCVNDIPNEAWTINFHTATCRKGSLRKTADCMIVIGFEALARVARNEISLAQAVEDGAAYHEGSHEMLVQVQKMFSLRDNRRLRR